MLRTARPEGQARKQAANQRSMSTNGNSSTKPRRNAARSSARAKAKAGPAATAEFLGDRQPGTHARRQIGDRQDIAGGRVVLPKVSAAQSGFEFSSGLTVAPAGLGPRSAA